MRVYNKLVRDNIPDIIRKNGEIPCISILDDDKYLDELKTKLIEETNEFIESEELMELADILEVVEYFMEAKEKVVLTNMCMFMMMTAIFLFRIKSAEAGAE